MTGAPYHFVLGAPDPEMSAIEALAAQAGASVSHATGPDGRRVHPGNAYEAAPVAPETSTSVILVECQPLELHTAPGAEIIRVDHHRQGDPGYGQPPAKFLAASSIGQVVSLLARVDALPWPVLSWGDGPRGQFSFSGATSGDLGRWYVWRPGGASYVPHELVLCAAADHCLTAAYRGECPGVHPEDLMQWRAASRAAFQRRSVADVLADVRKAIATLEAAPTRQIAGVAVADLGDATVPEAPEAAARAGIPFLAVVAERDGRRKQVLQAAPAAVVEEFMADGGAYGDPARGFAGRYLN